MVGYYGCVFNRLGDFKNKYEDWNELRVKRTANYKYNATFDSVSIKYYKFNICKK